MKSETAFIGDIHGNLTALQRLVSVIRKRDVEHVVALGDYINKGSNSSGVLSFLCEMQNDVKFTLLRGNHDAMMLESLEQRRLAPFLKMGGAMTIRSYVGGDVGPDVLSEFVATVPQGHLTLLRSLSDQYVTESVVAMHAPDGNQIDQFAVTAHRYIGKTPQINHDEARIDTGCGDAGGRLTAFLWPSRNYIQVTSDGDLLPSMKR